MKQYNRALDYTALALSELKAGKTNLAARLLAKAAEQSDLTAAIATLEASNAHAFKLSASKRLKADDMGMEDEMADGEFAGDPLEEVAGMDDEEGMDDMGDEEAPEMAMAKVLSKMVRKAGRR